MAHTNFAQCVILKIIIRKKSNINANLSFKNLNKNDHCAMLLLLAASSRLDIAYTHGCCHLVNFPWNCAPKFGQNSIFERRMLLLHHQMPLLNAQLEGKYKKERKPRRGIFKHSRIVKKNHVWPSKKNIFGRIRNAKRLLIFKAQILSSDMDKKLCL